MVRPTAKVPFNAKQAKELQQQWATYLGREVVETNVAGMRMILIPPGVFAMGTPDAEMDKLIKDMRADPELRRWINWVIGHTLDVRTRGHTLVGPEPECRGPALITIDGHLDRRAERDSSAVLHADTDPKNVLFVRSLPCGR